MIRALSSSRTLRAILPSKPFVVIEIAQANTEQLIVILFLGKRRKKFYSHIVLGKTMHGLTARRLLKQHLCFRTNILGIKLLRLLVAQLQESLGAQLLLLVTHHIRNLERSRTRAFRIRET